MHVLLRQLLLIFMLFSRSRDQIKCTQCEKEDQNAESEEFSIINKEQVM